MAAYSDEDQILQSRSVPELVREEIMRLITTGQLTAGAKLNEMDFPPLSDQPGADPRSFSGA